MRPLPRLLIALVLSFGIVALSPGQDPYFALKQALELQGHVPATALQKREDPFTGSNLLVKVVTHPRYGEMSRIVEPLERQGIRQLDDRSTIRVYFPDRNEVHTQISSWRWRANTDERIQMIRANYRVSFGRREEIADKTAQSLIIEPKSDLLAKRVIWYDVNNRYILRYSVRSEENWDTRLDTISVSYDNPAASEFELPSNARVVARFGPLGMNSATDAERYLRVYPPVPSSWPHGFRAEAMQIVGSEAAPLLAVRLTDGMAAVTVYFWNASQHPQPPVRSGVLQRSGCQIGALGEVSSELRTKLVQHAAQVHVWDQEHIAGTPLFQDNRGYRGFLDPPISVTRESNP
jgi:hypothetical protein